MGSIIALALFACVFISGVVFDPLSVRSLMLLITTPAILLSGLHPLMKRFSCRNRATMEVEKVGMVDVVTYHRNPWTKNEKTLKVLGFLILVCNIIFLSSSTLACGQVVHAIWVQAHP